MFILFKINNVNGLKMNKLKELIEEWETALSTDSNTSREDSVREVAKAQRAGDVFLHRFKGRDYVIDMFEEFRDEIEARLGKKEFRELVKLEKKDENSFDVGAEKYTLFMDALVEYAKSEVKKIDQKTDYEISVADESAVGGWNIKINDTVIDDDVFNEELSDYEIPKKEYLIEKIQGYLLERVKSADNSFADEEIKEVLEDRCDEEFVEDGVEEIIRDKCKSDSILMLQDLRLLQNLNDKYVLSNINTNEYIAQSDNPERFNEICEEILEANTELLKRKTQAGLVDGYIADKDVPDIDSDLDVK